MTPGVFVALLVGLVAGAVLNDRGDGRVLGTLDAATLPGAARSESATGEVSR